VLTNLIFNALDAMPLGGTLAIRGWSEGDHVYMSVRDTGIGMSQEVRKRLFEPFFTTKGDLGTGLGLSVCKRVIEEHLGRIEVTSSQGEGSTFTLSLPRASQTAADSPKHGATAERSTLRVLVVDDEPQVCDVLLRMLRLDGHCPQAVATGREALEVFSQRHFDIVLTDLGLPDVNGWQVVRTVKASNSSVPVVLITGWTDEGERPLPGGDVDAVLVKPFGIADLRRVIASAMDGSRGAGGVEGS